MADQVSAGGLPSAGQEQGRGPRQGIVIRGFPPGSTDQETLEVAFYKAVKGDFKCGVPEITSCHFTEDMRQAYVELADPTGEYVCLLSMTVITNYTYMYLLSVYMLVYVSHTFHS